MKTIGVIGQGFVGTAIREGMKHALQVITYDKKDSVINCYFKETHEETIIQNKYPMSQVVVEVSKNPNFKVIFLCLPTPMLPDGSCDTSIIEDIVKEIDGYYSGTLVIKSTIPPGTVDKLNKICKQAKVCFNPEFLTERVANQDFENQKYIIVGGPLEATNAVKHCYQVTHPDIPVFKTDAKIAEMTKYITNCFLATKVAFANEAKQICDKLEIDYDKVVEYACYNNPRMGISHWAVPGHDGKSGFSGSCFPKDINALMKVAESLGVDPKVMRGAWEKNLEVRPEKDWEQLKGRAVVG
jgi:nucleotide sugar dehydrogenase